MKDKLIEMNEVCEAIEKIDAFFKGYQKATQEKDVEIEELKKICYTKDNEGLPECFRCKSANPSIIKETLKKVEAELTNIHQARFTEEQVKFIKLKLKEMK